MAPARRTLLRHDFLALYSGTPAWQLSLAVAAALCAGAPLPVMSLVTGEVIDAFGSADAQPLVVRKVWQLVIVAVGFFLLSWTYMALFALIGVQSGVRLRRRYMRALLAADDVRQVEGRKLEVVTALGESVDTVVSATGEKAGLLVQSLAYFISAFAVSFTKGPQLTATLLPVIPCLTAVVWIGNRYGARLTARLEAVEAGARRFSHECFDNVRLVKIAGCEDAFAAEFAARLSKSVGVSVRRAFTGALVTGATFFLIYATNALAFWRGSQLIVQLDQAGAGATYVVISLVLDSSFVVGMVSPFLQLFAAAGATGKKLDAQIAQFGLGRPATKERGSRTECQTEGRAIAVAFDNVSMSYASKADTPALCGLSLRVDAGQFVGIVGASGSGKSTLLSLLSRFEEPSSGTVSFDGIDLRHLAKEDIRRRTALVSQDNLMLTGTIFDNIALGLVRGGLYGTAEARELVFEAARLADVTAFLDALPDGLDTRVGPSGGARLSLGQRQRIALARALVGRPKLLLLDEATSALDGASERRIVHNLEHWAAPQQGGVTVISVAHRLSAIKHADRIFVVDQGAIVESGTHEELLSCDGHYAQLAAQPDSSSSSPRSSSSTESEIELGEARKMSVANTLGGETLFGPQLEEGEKLPVIDEETAASEGAIKPEVDLSAAVSWPKLLSAGHSAIAPAVCGFAVAAAVGVIPTADALLFGNLISAMNDVADPAYLLSRSALLAAFFVLVAGAALLGYTGMGTLFALSNARLSLRLQQKLFRHWLGAPLAFHTAAETSADRLSGRIQTDAAGLAGLSGQFIGTTLSVLVSILSGVVLAHIVAWKIALVFLPAVPVIILAGFLRLRVAAKNQERSAGAATESLAIAAEAVHDIRGVAAYGLGELVNDRFDAVVSRTHADAGKFLATSTALLALAYALPFVIYALAYLWGSFLVSSGQYATKDFFIVLPALLFSAQTAGQVFSMAPDFSRAKRAASSILRAFAADCERLDVGLATNTTAAAAMPKSGVKFEAGCLEFKNVNFTYPGAESPVLNNISFTVPAGSRVALVGASGCGKSTVLNLIARLHDIDVDGAKFGSLSGSGSTCVGDDSSGGGGGDETGGGGQIQLDGIDTRKMSLQQLRSRLWTVAQEPKLFNDTIRFNLTLGRPLTLAGGRTGDTGGRAGGTGGRNEDEIIREALAKAQMLDYIDSLPNGLSTILGSRDGEIGLSGGQRQRLEIARAILFATSPTLNDLNTGGDGVVRAPARGERPKLLLLDEPTSALDPITERHIDAALHDLAKNQGVTQIAVAHRRSCIERADIVVFLHEGTVVATGAHERLMAEEPRYAALLGRP